MNVINQAGKFSNKNNLIASVSLSKSDARIFPLYKYSSGWYIKIKIQLVTTCEGIIWQI
jgi:hypothetical protein